MALQAKRPSKKVPAKTLSSLNKEAITKRFNAEIPEKLMVRLKVRAAKDGISLTELAKTAFTDYLRK